MGNNSHTPNQKPLPPSFCNVFWSSSHQVLSPSLPPNLSAFWDYLPIWLLHSHRPSAQSIIQQTPHLPPFPSGQKQNLNYAIISTWHPHKLNRTDHCSFNILLTLLGDKASLAFSNLCQKVLGAGQPCMEVLWCSSWVVMLVLVGRWWG